MKKYPHQQFIKDNAIDINSLPNMLQKRIHGFDELENDLQHTTEHDRAQLVDKLETLSHEIQEDLDEEFDERLENNDVEEEAILNEPEKIPTIADSVKMEPPGTPSPIPGEIIIEQTHTPNPKEIKEEENIPSDEAILHEMFSEKRLKISPSQLIRKGFQKPLDKKIIVGSYILRRGKYDNYYELNKIENF